MVTFPAEASGLSTADVVGGIVLQVCARSDSEEWRE